MDRHSDLILNILQDSGEVQIILEDTIILFQLISFSDGILKWRDDFVNRQGKLGSKENGVLLNPGLLVCFCFGIYPAWQPSRSSLPCPHAA